MKAINTQNIHKYMLGYESGEGFYLLKSKGSMTISAKRALEWLNAGIEVFDRSEEDMRELILEDFILEDIKKVIKNENS